jgi:hypothetical protein
MQISHGKADGLHLGLVIGTVGTPVKGRMLWVSIDQEHIPSLSRKTGRQVSGNGGFPCTSLLIDNP